jgi:hypothetical protein
MIVAYENEVRDVVYTYDITKLRFNRTESICYQRFEKVDVQMLCVINVLKLMTDDQDLILNRTIKSTDDIADVVFIRY